MVMSLIVLVIIVGVRTYIYEWSMRHIVWITVAEVMVNLSIVWDYVLNLIDAPEKMEFISSMYDFSSFCMNDSLDMACSTLQLDCL